MSFFGKAGASIALIFGLAATFDRAYGEAATDLIEKGKYLTAAAGCVACHTAPGGEVFAGNNAIPTPFGTIYSSNITPDKETGIGTFTDDQFYAALHEGRGADGSFLYPAMPFPSYTKISRDDVLAIKAYIFSLKPVHSEKKPNKLAFPYNIRDSLAAWRALYFTPGTFQPDPAKSSKINRGAYLVQGLAHCGECHTPRNIAGAKESGKALAGTALQGWYAPNISSDLSQGIGGWSDEDLLSFFKKGVAPGHGIAIGPMAEVVHDDLSRLSDDDLKAIIAYLKSTPPKKEEATEVFGSREAAGRLFLTACASCHMPDGQGVKGKIPALAGNGAVKAVGPENVIKAILGGLRATDTFGPMPSFADALDDDQIASLTNYVRTRWGNNAPTNADGFLVTNIRQNTPMMLVFGEGNTLCPAELTSGAEAVANRAKDASSLLQSIADDTMVPSLEKLVPEIKAALPNATPADIVNGLTVAYCHKVAANDALTITQKRNKLSLFSQLTYTEAVSGSIAGQPADNGASLK